MRVFCGHAGRRECAKHLAFSVTATRGASQWWGHQPTLAESGLAAVGRRAQDYRRSFGEAGPIFATNCRRRDTQAAGASAPAISSLQDAQCLRLEAHGLILVGSVLDFFASLFSPDSMAEPPNCSFAASEPLAGRLRDDRQLLWQFRPFLLCDAVHPRGVLFNRSAARDACGASLSRSDRRNRRAPAFPLPGDDRQTGTRAGFQYR